MSFVGGPYTHDVFISYSHGDVRGVGDSNFKRWSTTFWRELLLEFESHDDLRGLSIFFDSSDRQDDSVNPFVELDPLLKTHVSNSAIFLPLISPRYLKPDGYCLQELAWWREAQEARQLDTRGRLAPVLIWGTPPNGTNNWPEALKPIGLSQLMGVTFYARDKALSKPQPFGWPGGVERMQDQRFFEQLLEVVGYLRQHLLEFRSIVAERDTKPVPPPRKPSIYLHGRDDAPELWDKAADALSDAGFPISPDGPEPMETDAAKRADIRAARIGAMSTCDALIVIGPEDSNLFREELMILGTADRHLAIDRAEQMFGQSGKRMPWAVIDPVSDPRRAERRRDWAEKSRLGWFGLNDPAWVDRATEWLGASV